MESRSLAGELSLLLIVGYRIVELDRHDPPKRQIRESQGRMRII